MLVEKNVFDNIIGTLHNITGKTKNGVKAKKDLVEMGITSSWHQSRRDKKHFCHQYAILFLEKRRLT